MLRRPRVITLLMIFSDILLINLAFALAYWMRYDRQWFLAVDPAFNVPYSSYVPFALILTVILIGIFHLDGVYRRKRIDSWFDEMYPIFNGITTGIILMMAIVYFLVRLSYSRLIFFYAGAFIIIFLGISRVFFRIIEGKMLKQGIGVARILIVGAGETGRTVMRTIVAHPELGFEIVGFVDDDPVKGQTDIGKFKALGGLGGLVQVIRERMVDEAIVTLPWQHHQKILSVVGLCEQEKVRARIVPDLFQMTLNRMDIIELAGIPLIGVKEIRISGIGRIVKRGIDFSIALFGILLLAPLMAVISLAIRLDSPGSALFKQIRVGKGGKKFVFYKFRSMIAQAEELKDELLKYNEANGPLFKIKDDPRRTAVGKFLRRFSLDELPQLYNVLTGEMSLVGPRPPVPEEVEKYQDWHKRRLEIAPGITGLWQVSGRSELSFDEMALLDIYYIENWSAALDIRILLQTIPHVIFGRGAY